MTATDAHRRAQGVHGVGSAEYSDDEYRQVVAAFLAHRRSVTAAELSRETGTPGLTLRQIMSAADGIDFLLGGSGADGYCQARTVEDAARLTARFASQVNKMSARIERRERFAARLGSRQPDLFGGDES